MLKCGNINVDALSKCLKAYRDHQHCKSEQDQIFEPIAGVDYCLFNVRCGEVSSFSLEPRL